MGAGSAGRQRCPGRARAVPGEGGAVPGSSPPCRWKGALGMSLGHFWPGGSSKASPGRRGTGSDFGLQLSPCFAKRTWKTLSCLDFPQGEMRPRASCAQPRAVPAPGSASPGHCLALGAERSPGGRGAAAAAGAGAGTAGAGTAGAAGQQQQRQQGQGQQQGRQQQQQCPHTRVPAAPGLSAPRCRPGRGQPRPPAPAGPRPAPPSVPARFVVGGPAGTAPAQPPRSLLRGRDRSVRSGRRPGGDAPVAMGSTAPINNWGKELS